jgi:hypothetical protein
MPNPSPLSSFLSLAKNLSNPIVARYRAAPPGCTRAREGCTAAGDQQSDADRSSCAGVWTRFRHCQSPPFAHRPSPAADRKPPTRPPSAIQERKCGPPATVTLRGSLSVCQKASSGAVAAVHYVRQTVSHWPLRDKTATRPLGPIPLKQIVARRLSEGEEGSYRIRHHSEAMPPW